MSVEQYYSNKMIANQLISGFFSGILYDIIKAHDMYLEMIRITEMEGRSVAEGCGDGRREPQFRARMSHEDGLW